MNIPALNKVVKYMSEYFEMGDADPFGLANRLRMAPQHTQEKVFDFCMLYIQDVAESEVYSYAMKTNQQIARDLFPR